MSTLILTTKLHVPVARTRVVPRPRLVERLKLGLERSLTLVSAPAGFGKSTLLSDWVQEIAAKNPQASVAWLSLDDEDNDFARFWTYVIAALQTVHPSLGRETLKFLQTSPIPMVSASLTPVLNELATHTRDVVLILDDYHRISAAKVHESIEFVLDHQPANLHLVIAGRADPPLPTARLRANHQLVELRFGDLRFNHEETTAFLNTVMGLDLTEADVTVLEARTEGWIAGLQLTALSLQDREDTSEFIATLAAGRQFILEYLADEVMRRQPEPVQRFLLETSILDRLYAPLCDAVCLNSEEHSVDSPETSHRLTSKYFASIEMGRDVAGRRDAAAMLAYLQQRNLFLVPLDDEKKWYRYHHLFSDLLGNLRRTAFPTDHIHELHRRASQWHALSGSADKAITHALRANDFDRAADLMEQAVRGTMLHGRLSAFLRWLEQLPESTLATHPRLFAHYGWALHLSARSDKAEQILLLAREALNNLPASPENTVLRGEVAAMLASIATLGQSTSSVIQEGEKALKYLSPDDRISRARVFVAMGTAHAYQGDTDLAVSELNEAKKLALKAGNPFLASAAMEILAGMYIFEHGRLRKGARILEQILSLGTTSDGTQYPFVANAHVLLAEVFLERNELDTAAGHMEVGMELLQKAGIGYGLTHAYCAQARVLRARADSSGALAALDSAARSLQACPLRHAWSHLMLCQVQIRLSLADAETASHWATGDATLKQCEKPEEMPLTSQEIQAVALAWVHLANGETSRALALCEEVSATAAAAGHTIRLIEIAIVSALALHARGERCGALEALGEALSLAAPEGYVRLFLDQGDAMLALLSELSTASADACPYVENPLIHDAAADYARQLIKEFAKQKNELKQGQDSAPIPARIRISTELSEPLTRRELEVLSLIDAGYTNQQIASELVLALNTVKRHTSNIYGKLGVHSRTQALVRSKELGLL